MSTQQLLHLEDLEPGHRFVSGEYQVGQDEIIRFAQQYDPQPFHTDPDAARKTFFGGLAGSGWHTAAITMRLLVDGGLPIAGGIIGAGGQLSWPSPLRPGSTVHVETEVLDVSPSKSKPDRGIVAFRSRTIDDSGKDVQVTEMKLLVFRRSA